jgi:hypothetical protein
LLCDLAKVYLDCCRTDDGWNKLLGPAVLVSLKVAFRSRESSGCTGVPPVLRF